MKRLLAAVSLLVPLTAACGDDSDSGGGKKALEPKPASFEGIVEVKTADPQEATVFWMPATPGTDENGEPVEEELQYRVWWWSNHPDSANAEVRSFDVPDTLECNPRCRFRYNAMVRQDVNWFAVEMIDGEGNSSGKERILPGAVSGPPGISEVQPSVASAGDEVVIFGEAFLDERIGDEGLTLAGVPVPAEQVTSWQSHMIRIRVGAGMVGGTLEVKTVNGAATSTLEILE